MLQGTHTRRSHRLHAFVYVYLFSRVCLSFHVRLCMPPLTTSTNAFPQDEAADGPSNETLEKMFADIDENGSGDITRDEMESALTQMFGKLEPDVVDQMMNAADTDNDGDVECVRAAQMHTPLTCSPTPKSLAHT